MYYDRRVPEELAALLADGGPLEWLRGFADSPSGRENLAHIQFRRNQSGLTRGGIGVYFGRTTPLCIEGRSGQRVRMTADKQNERHTPQLFSRAIAIRELAEMRTTMEQHLCRCAHHANGAFITGEARPHAGMLRHYGPSSCATSRLWVVDSECRFGYDSRPERQHREAAMRSQLGLREREQMPRKLDTLAILPDGNAAVVEVKDEDGDLERAVVQAAWHVSRFRELRAREGYELRDVMMGQARQRARVGLLSEQFGAMSQQFQLVPVVAAPVHEEDWLSGWLSETERVRARLAEALHGLRFWRLSPDGEVLEEHVV